MIVFLYILFCNNVLLLTPFLFFFNLGIFVWKIQIEKILNIMFISLYFEKIIGFSACHFGEAKVNYHSTENYQPLKNLYAESEENVWMEKTDTV
jgi:hypothetical protein